MNKLLLTILAGATVALASCSNDEIIDQMTEPQAKAISFNGSFVNKPSRGGIDVTVSNMTHFNAYGYQSPDGNDAIVTRFDKVKVSNNSGVWTYSPQQYWTVDNEYWFSGIFASLAGSYSYTPSATEWPTGINYTDRLWGGKILFNNGINSHSVEGANLQAANSNVDLVYGWWKTAAPVTVGNEPTVGITFKHLLSKVAFKFTNSLPNNDIKITNLVIQNVDPVGVLDLNAATPAWVTSGTGEDISYSAELTNQAIASNKSSKTESNFMIPSDWGKYTISFTIQQLDGNTVLKTYVHNGVKVNLDMAMGCSYVLTCDINTDNINPDGALKPIEFAPSVSGWDSGADTPVVMP